jgi:hypothetical protein
MHYTEARPMYLRWQSRRRKPSPYGAQHNEVKGVWLYKAADREGWFLNITWRAIIVESTWIDGKAKQRHIAYLAGFTESEIGHDCYRVRQWERTKAKLDSLGNRLSERDRRRIEAAIEAKLGAPPTATQAEEAQRVIATNPPEVARMRAHLAL